MEALGVASSVIAIVELSAKVASLCFEYSKGVKHAKDDINRLRSEINNLQHATKSVQRLLDGPKSTSLEASQPLRDAIHDGRRELERLHKTLAPKTARQTIHRLGFRSLTWPFQSKDVKKVMDRLGQCTQTISFALQIDQAAILLDVDRKMMLDQLSVAEGASFDSIAEERNPTCLPSTRVEILRQIQNWAYDSTGESIFWLNGMAGTGKSTLSRTVAQSFAAQGRLGASFFFKRGETDRGTIAKFFATIAADLLHRKPATALCIKNALDADSSISTRNTRHQFEQLFLKPLSNIVNDTKEAPIVIVVDALDECERDSDIKLIIDLFSRAKAELSQVKIFLTSRPELPLRLEFATIQGTYQDAILHELPQPLTERDISIFLKHRLMEIRMNFNASVADNRQLHKNWPSQSDIQSLAKMSVPLFIFAATVCLYIADRKLGNPEKQLTKVLNHQSRSQQANLNDTYLLVLRQQIADLDQEEEEEILQEFREIVGPIVILSSPLSTKALSRLLGISQHTVDDRLDLLHSVLSVPKSSEEPIRLLHLSFRDFLVNPNGRERNPFWVDEGRTHAVMAARCLRILSGLKQDICDMISPGKPRSDINFTKISSSLPPELQYACLYWVYHLEKANIYVSDDTDVHIFLTRHFLHWVEALAIMGRTSESLGLLNKLQSRLEDKKSSELSLFFQDAMRFIRTHLSVISSTPLQLYSSLLTFTPKSSKVRTIFEGSKDKAEWICLGPLVEDSWGQCLQTLEGHSSIVHSVAFSHDSALIVSGSYDKTVRIWRADTGECMQTLEGHSDGVLSVVFSHDSTLVASGSHDTVMRLWRVDTGECVQTLEGHSNQVWSVAFSHDSALVASASQDKTVRIWRADTGKCVQTLDGHGSGVRSVAFSHNSALIVSGSYDKTVRIWRTDIGKCVKTLEGHSDPVGSVAFSRDSALVASASHDKTVRIWRADTGKCVQTLDGHGSGVRSVAFSHNSALIVSGSYDKMVRIWRTDIGKCVQTLEGHGELVQSVAFSHNSALVVSGSYDKTVRIWRANIGKCVQTPKGHSDLVRSVAFSHNSALIASGSDDKTVRIWSSDTGECIQTLEAHSGWVWSVTFSHDSALVASGSGDKTVRIWRADTGDSIQALEGHSDWVRSVAFSHDSAFIVSGSYDKTVRIWRADTGECMQTLEGHSDGVLSVVFSHDSTLVASGSHDTVMRLWRVDTGECVQTLEGHSDQVGSVAFSHDSALVASASWDKSVRIWRANTGECMQTAHIGYVSQHLSFNRNGSHLLTGVGTIATNHSSLTDVARSAQYSGIGISADHCWITWDEKPLLWLPVEFRPFCSAVSESMIVLGSRSGKVAIIRLSPDCSI